MLKFVRKSDEVKGRFRKLEEGATREFRGLHSLLGNVEELTQSSHDSCTSEKKDFRKVLSEAELANLAGSRNVTTFAEIRSLRSVPARQVLPTRPETVPKPKHFKAF